MKNRTALVALQLGFTALVGATALSFTLTNHSITNDTASVSHSTNLARVQSRRPVAAPNYRQYDMQRLNTGVTPVLPQSVGNDYLADVVGEGMYQWPADKLPIKVYIAPGNDVPGFKPQYREMMEKSFSTWQSATNGRISWVKVNDRAQANITVDWTNGVHERPEGTEAGKTSTMTRLNTETNVGTIYGARMQILTRLPEREFADEEVQKTCLHEAGHALGIQGHSPYRDDIMFYAVSPTQKPYLTSRDGATMTRLYSEYPVRSSAAEAITAVAPRKSASN
jgi:hypothetical protein